MEVEVGREGGRARKRELQVGRFVGGCGRDELGVKQKSNCGGVHLAGEGI